MPSNPFSKRKLSSSGFLLMVVLLVVGSLIKYCQHREKRPEPEPVPSSGQLQIYAIDVGQGDSLLIVTPEKKTVLIDAGLAQAGDQVVNFLKSHQIERLDLVVATHPHADHIGGMREVLNALPVKAFLDSGQPHPTKTYTQMLETIKAKVGKLTIAKAGQKFSLDSGITLSVLGPREPWLKHVSGSDINANSVILRLSYGNFAMLFTGDSEDETETRLLGDGTELAAQVLKIAHHGSRYASTEAFLNKVHPEAAVISCGTDNDYGHPSQSTLDRLKRMGVKLYRTDLEGDIQITSDGNTYQIHSAHTAGSDLWAGRRPRGSNEVGSE